MVSWLYYLLIISCILFSQLKIKFKTNKPNTNKMKTKHSYNFLFMPWEDLHDRTYMTGLQHWHGEKVLSPTLDQEDICNPYLTSKGKVGFLPSGCHLIYHPHSGAGPALVSQHLPYSMCVFLLISLYVSFVGAFFSLVLFCFLGEETIILDGAYIQKTFCQWRTQSTVGFRRVHESNIW